MPTNFPTSLDSYSTKVNAVDTVNASHINDLQDAVAAIETSLLATGVWTPVFQGSTTNPTITYNSGITYGVYYKIGSIVLLTGALITTAYSGGSGNLRVGGMPFLARNAIGGVAWNGNIGYSVNWASNAPRAIRALSGQSYLELYDTNSAAVPVSALSSTINFQFTVLYAI